MEITHVRSQRVYDPNTLSWVAAQQSVLQAGTVNLVPSGLATEASLTAVYTTKMAYTGANPIYIGMAAHGSLSSAAAWQIRKLTYDVNNLTDVQYAGGTHAFDKIWDNRADLTYT